MYQCFHCGHCGANITYMIPCNPIADDAPEFEPE